MRLRARVIVGLVGMSVAAVFLSVPWNALGPHIAILRLGEDDIDVEHDGLSRRGKNVLALGVGAFPPLVARARREQPLPTAPRPFAYLALCVAAEWYPPPAPHRGPGLRACDCPPDVFEVMALGLRSGSEHQRIFVLERLMDYADARCIELAIRHWERLAETKGSRREKVTTVEALRVVAEASNLADDTRVWREARGDEVLSSDFTRQLREWLALNRARLPQQVMEPE